MLYLLTVQQNAPCIVYFQFIIVTALFVLHFVPQYGMTACMWAIVRGHTDVVKLFLSSGVHVDLQNEVRHNIHHQYEPYQLFFLCKI